MQLLRKQIRPLDNLTNSSHKNFSDYNYKRNFYAKYFVHSEAFRAECYQKIKQKLYMVEKEDERSMTRTECDRFFRLLMKMQGNVGCKGNTDKDSFWR